jgi:hypothetical protein
MELSWLARRDEFAAKTKNNLLNIFGLFLPAQAGIQSWHQLGISVCQQRRVFYRFR